MTLPQAEVVPHTRERFPFRVIDVSKINKSYLVPPHWHEHIELIKIVEGKVRVTIDHESFTAQRDEIIFINSRRVHSVTSLSGDDVRLQGMIFDPFFEIGRAHV